MELERECICYALMIIDYMCQLTGMSQAHIARKMGEKNLEELVYMAPMYRHLPIDRMAKELLWTFEISYCRQYHHAEAHPDIGNDISLQVISNEPNKLRYATALYQLLVGSDTLELPM